MDLTKKRWLILAVCCMANLCTGTTYAWSVYVNPMAEYLSAIAGSPVKNIALASSTCNSVGWIMMIALGLFDEILGPRLIFLIGGLLVGGGFLISSFSTSLTMLIIGYGIVLPFGTGAIYGSTISTAIKFFPDRQGMAGGLVTAAGGLGSVITPLIAEILIIDFGIARAFEYLGIGAAGLVIIAACLVQRCPANFKPRGWVPSVEEQVREEKGDKTWREMLHSPIFYVMFFILCAGAFPGVIIFSQASPMAQRNIGLSVTGAAVTVSLLSLLNTCGRAAAGILLDLLGVTRTLGAIFVLAITGHAILLCSGAGEALQFHVGIACVGLAYGALLGAFPGLASIQFGSKHNSVNYGIMFIGFALSGASAPQVITRIYNTLGSYDLAYVTAMALALSGFCLNMVYAAMRHREEASLPASKLVLQH